MKIKRILSKSVAVLLTLIMLVGTMPLAAMAEDEVFYESVSVLATAFGEYLTSVGESNVVHSTDIFSLLYEVEKEGWTLADADIYIEPYGDEDYLILECVFEKGAETFEIFFNWNTEENFEFAYIWAGGAIPRFDQWDGFDWDDFVELIGASNIYFNFNYCVICEEPMDSEGYYTCDCNDVLDSLRDMLFSGISVYSLEDFVDSLGEDIDIYADWVDEYRAAIYDLAGENCGVLSGDVFVLNGGVFVFNGDALCNPVTDCPFCAGAYLMNEVVFWTDTERNILNDNIIAPIISVIKQVTAEAAEATAHIINLDDPDPPASGNGWYRVFDMYTIEDGADVIVTGTGDDVQLSLRDGATAKVTLRDASITTDTLNNSIYISGNSTMNLYLEGTNSLTAIEEGGMDAIYIISSSLNIDGTGSLTATGGASMSGISSIPNGNVTIKGGEIIAQGGTGGGSGIDGGNVTITGGTVTAIAGDTYVPAIYIGSASVGAVTVEGQYDYWTNTTNTDPGGDPTGSGTFSWNDTYRYIKLVEQDMVIVKFNSNGGSAVPDLKVYDYPIAIAKPTDPTFTNATFLGWFTDEDLTVEWNFTNTVADNMTLYAKWDYHYISVDSKIVVDPTVTTIQSAIENALANNTTVKVTGKFTNADSTLSISISEDKTLVWDAEYSGTSDDALFAISGEGSMIIDEKANISNNGGGYAIDTDVAGSVNVILDGGTVSGGSGGATIDLRNNATLSVLSGKVEGVIYTYGNAVVYVEGGDIANNAIIYNSGKPTGYYIGDNARKFHPDFTTYNTLFKLDDAPALTIEDGSAYIFDFANPAHAGAVTATFPAGLDITEVTASLAAARNTLSGNTVIFAGAFMHDNLTLAVKGTLANGKIPVEFTTAAFAVNVQKAETTVTVAALDDITYGGTLGDPSGATAAADGGTFTYRYTGTMLNNTTYSLSTTKPTAPGTYRVVVDFDSDTHIGRGTSADFTISPKQLTWNADGTVESKPYDGTTTATIATAPTLSGIVGTDTVTVTSGTVTFANANAGTSVAVTATDFTIGGADAWKYDAPTVQPTFANGAIEPRDISEATLTVTGGPYSYTGSQIQPTISVGDSILGGAPLTASDYDISYGTNVNVGTDTGSVTITGKGNYSGTQTVSFDIGKAAAPSTVNVTERFIQLTAGSRSVNLADLRPARTSPAVYGDTTYTAAVSDSTGILDGFSVGAVASPTAMEIAVKNTATVGQSATITVTAASANYGNFDIIITVSIVDKTDVSDLISFAGGNATYTGVELSHETATITGVTGGTWSYSYAVQVAGVGSLGGNGKPLGAGTYTVTATYEDDENFGTKTATFTVNPRSIAGASVSLRSTISYTYDGSAKTPIVDDLSVTLSGASSNLHYSCYTIQAISNNTNAGTATVTVAGIGDYTGTATGTFTIARAEQAALTATATPSGPLTFGTDTTVALGTDGGSGDGVVSYRVVSGPGRISGSTLTVTGAGDITITATKAGGTNHNSVTSDVLTIKVNPAPIDSVSVSVTAPVRGYAPDRTVIGEDNYGVLSMTWEGAPTFFAADTEYKATVTLRANANYTFDTGATATINGQTADVDVTDAGTVRNTVTLTYTFDPTDSVTTPTAPRNLKATAFDGEVVLDWAAPLSNGGAAITGYEVSSNNGDTWVSTGLSTVHVFTGLTNGTEYTFAVRAVNSEGKGAVATIKATPVAPPSSAPTPFVSVEDYVTGLYWGILNRAPDQGGLDSWVAAIRNGAMTAAEVERAFMFSEEAKGLTVGDDELFIENLYLAVLGRNSDSTGKSHWLAALKSGAMSHEEIYDAFTSSLEYEHLRAETYVTGLYEASLGRDPDEGGLKSWTDALKTGKITATELVRSFVFSEELLANPANNDDGFFVETLYQSFFGRASDAGGKTSWVGALTAGMERVDVFNSFASSQEFDYVCKAYGLVK